MYVKVVRDGTESIYECDRAHKRPMVDSETGERKPDDVCFALESHEIGGNIDLRCDAETRVFVMDSTGQTIERWL